MCARIIYLKIKHYVLHRLPPDALEHKSIEREIKYNNNHSFGNDFKSENVNQQNSNQSNLNQPSRNKRGPPPPNIDMSDNGNMNGNNNNNNINSNDARNYNNNGMNGNHQSHQQPQNNNMSGNNMSGNNGIHHQSQSSSSYDMNNNQNMSQNHRQKPQNPPHLQSQAQPNSFENEQKVYEHKEPELNGRREPMVLQEHNKWKEEIAKDYLLFKNKQCQNGMDCEKGINCARWHGPHDRRRDVRDGYSPEPCPYLFDIDKKEWDFNGICPRGDDCEFAHNRIEQGFHQKCYKTLPCPYYFITGSIDGNSQCPFERTAEWFIQQFGGENIKRIKRNTVSLKNGMKLALDYCPFAHHVKQRRYEDDPPITYDKDEANKDKHESTSVRNDPPHHSQSNPSNHLQAPSHHSLHSGSNNQHVSIPPHEMSSNPFPSPNPPPSHHSHHSYQQRPASNPAPSHHSYQSQQPHQSQSRYSPSRAPSVASMNNNNNNNNNLFQNNNNNNIVNNNSSYNRDTKKGPSLSELQQIRSENEEWGNNDDDDW